MNTDHVLVLVGTVAIIILLTLWVKVRSLGGDFTDETKKMDPYSEKPE
jgi:FtsZ-interacting cell division protein ZipA